MHVLDGVVPVISAVSIAAMGVATLGLLVTVSARRVDGVRSWLFALLAVGLGRIALAGAQRWARGRRLVGKPILIVGAGLVARRSPGCSRNILSTGWSRSVSSTTTPVDRRGGRTRRAGLGTVEDLDEIFERDGRAQTDRRVLIGGRRSHQPSGPALPGAGG